MIYKDTYKRILALPLVALLTCGACSFSTTSSPPPETSPSPSLETSTSTLPAHFNPDPPCDGGVTVSSATGLTHCEGDAGNGYLVPEFQGCLEDLIGVSFEPNKESEGGSDYVFNIMQARTGDCYITSLDIYFLGEYYERIHPILDHQGGKFTPFILKSSTSHKAEVHFDLNPTPGCYKAQQIEVIINRYIRTVGELGEESKVCATQIQGKKTIGSFIEVPDPTPHD